MALCQGKTKSGERCRREVGGDQFCHQHQPTETWDLRGLHDDGSISQADFGRLIDRSRQRVNQFVQQGMLELNEDGRLDLAESLHALISRGDIDRTDLPFKLYEKGLVEEDAGDDQEEDSLNRQLLVAKVNLKVQQARKARLKADEIEGMMVPAEEVERKWFDLTRQTRDKMLTIPDRVSAQLAGMTDERAIYDTLTDELRLALVDIADTIDDQHPTE